MRPGQQGDEVGAGENDPNQRNHLNRDIGRPTGPAVLFRTPFQIGRPGEDGHRQGEPNERHRHGPGLSCREVGGGIGGRAWESNPPGTLYAPHRF